MYKVDAKEAAPLLQRALMALLGAGPTSGCPGADLRTTCGYLYANALVLIQSDAAGQPLADCFEAARKVGFTQEDLSWFVRTKVMAEAPVTLGATLIKNCIIEMCLATECRIIADMVFTSRDDVEALKLQMNEAFSQAEEVAADDMDQATFRALVALHSALIYHLVETARPLPRMLQYQFAASLTTLVLGHRLYDDAGRADELRVENKIVHPAFAPMTGRALSA
jgi:hypothetical protein